MSASITVRPFSEGDTAQVRNLFIRVTRLLAPPHMTEVFEAYIARSLREEVDRIADYYAEKDGAFWVAVEATQVVGMFGLEPASTDAMELRRMYVNPDARRRGIARLMLQFAEDECRRRNRPRMELSTSEVQGAALCLYRKSGYELVREEVVVAQSNKTVGAGMRRFYFGKRL